MANPAGPGHELRMRDSTCRPKSIVGQRRWREIVKLLVPVVGKYQQSARGHGSGILSSGRVRRITVTVNNFGDSAIYQDGQVFTIQTGISI